jgi:hypothetical protein
VAITLIIWALPLYNTSIGLVFPADFIALYVVAGLVSALELPFCCSFTPICRKVQVLACTRSSRTASLPALPVPAHPLPLRPLVNNLTDHRAGVRWAAAFLLPPSPPLPSPYLLACCWK